MSGSPTRTSARRAAAGIAAERRKKVILIGLTVVLATVLAFQGPKLLKGSGSSSSAASTPTATTATPSAAAGSRSLAIVSRSPSAKRLSAIRRLGTKNPFVPLIHESASTSSSTSATATTSAPAPVAQPVAPVAPTVTKPAYVKPAAPNAAVIWTNGQRQVVGLSQVFKVGDAQFRLVGVTRNTIRMKVLGGAFSGRGQAITVHKGHRVKLANMATGVQYGLLFTQAGIAAPSTSSNSN